MLFVFLGLMRMEWQTASESDLMKGGQSFPRIISILLSKDSGSKII
jgi:hypothetical protein